MSGEWRLSSQVDFNRAERSAGWLVDDGGEVSKAKTNKESQARQNDRASSRMNGKW